MKPRVQEKILPKDYMRTVYKKHLTEIIMTAVKTHPETPIDIRLDKYIVNDYDAYSFTYGVYVKYLEDLTNHLFRVTIYADFNIECEKLK